MRLSSVRIGFFDEDDEPGFLAMKLPTFFGHVMDEFSDFDFHREATSEREGDRGVVEIVGADLERGIEGLGIEQPKWKFLLIFSSFRPI